MSVGISQFFSVVSGEPSHFIIREGEHTRHQHENQNTSLSVPHILMYNRKNISDIIKKSLLTEYRSECLPPRFIFKRSRVQVKVRKLYILMRIFMISVSQSQQMPRSFLPIYFRYARHCRRMR
jgi:hypothetical protein